MTWWHYLLLVNIYLTLFFGFYALLLRRETFFQLNRVYLVGAAVLSFFIPLIQAQWVRNLFITQQVQSTIYSTTAPEIIGAFEPMENNPVTVGEIITLLYVAGAALLAFRLIWQLFQVKQLMAKPTKEAYSFFKTIKLGDENPDQDIIIKHEEVHARQWHSADVLIIEAVMIINWFNPVVYLYRFAIKHVHEFIADSKALEAGTNKADYAMLLLSQTFNAPTHGLVNPFFNHSLLKQRIMMLQKNRSQRIKLAKYGLSAPLFILMLVLSSATINNSKAVTEINKHTENVFEKSATSIIPDSPAGEIVTARHVDELTIDTVPNPTELFTVVEHSPGFPGGDKAFGKFLAKNIKYPAEAFKNKVEGRVIATFVVERDGSLTGIKIVRGVGSGTDEESLRVLKLSPNWKPGIQNGHAVRVKYSVPIQFMLAGNKTASAKATDKPVLIMEPDNQPIYPGGWGEFNKYIAQTLKYPAKARANKTQGRVIVTFVVEPTGDLTDVHVVRGIGDGADEEAVRVIKASPKWIAKTVDGKKVKTQFTVPINFSLEKPTATKTGKVADKDKFYNLTASTIDTAAKVKQTVILRDFKGGAVTSPLYMVNGKEVASIEYLEPNDIKSISVIKNKDAIVQYGAKGLNGVILVETKSAKVKP